MCTIGNLKTEVSRLTFKQCDLAEKVEFYKPQVQTAATGIRYVAFMRKGSEGAWCGVNEYGVAFVAADSYVDESGNLQSVSNDIFTQYLRIITDYKTAREAAAMMKAFYQDSFLSPDILMITDAVCAFFLEAAGGQVVMTEREDGFFASTNHFRMVYGAAPYRQNHSTYLRLQRTESILQTDPTPTGVKAVLSDRYYGDSVWSVCRSNTLTAPQEEPYFTQASAIFHVTATEGVKVRVDCDYIINGNPANTLWTYWENIFI